MLLQPLLAEEVNHPGRVPILPSGSRLPPPFPTMPASLVCLLSAPTLALFLDAWHALTAAPLFQSGQNGLARASQGQTGHRVYLLPARTWPSIPTTKNLQRVLLEVTIQGYQTIV